MYFAAGGDITPRERESQAVGKHQLTHMQLNRERTMRNAIDPMD
jgi:hypothetical protein